MLFSSYDYLIFVQIMFLLYFIVNKYLTRQAALKVLLTGSLFFYGYWDPIYIVLITASILTNFLIGKSIHAAHSNHKRKLGYALLAVGVCFNMVLLCIFKYDDFLIGNVNFLFGTSIPMAHLILPLAISFYTFQQIAFLVDVNRGEQSNYRFIDYALFVLFFPQLIAGPIVHHTEMIPQFYQKENVRINWENISLGIAIFSIGIFKKVMIADAMIATVNAGFDGTQALEFISAWVTALSYTYQLYFDFSGYADMAIGTGLLFNIRLPENFNSPYRAKSIQDFWRRWHLTLSRWLRDYLYIPLGGSQCSTLRTAFNLFITFLLGGMWHGANWTFAIWGAMHGCALIIERTWKRLGFLLPSPFAWMITFVFVILGWVTFRATSLSRAISIYKGMFFCNGISLPAALKGMGFHATGISFHGLMPMMPDDLNTILLLILVSSIALFMPNTRTLVAKFKPNLAWLTFIGAAFSIAFINLNHVSDFLYFQF